MPPASIAAGQPRIGYRHLQIHAPQYLHQIGKHQIKKEGAMPQNHIIEGDLKVRGFAEQLANCLTRRGKLPNGCSTLLMSAYALYKSQRYSPDAMPSFRDMLDCCKGDALVQNSIADSLADCWDALRPLYGVYEAKTLSSYILNAEMRSDPRRGCYATPPSVAALALELLKIDDNDSVADFGAGNGNFLVSACIDNSKATYFGIEIKKEMAATAAIRAELLGSATTIEHGNMFSLYEDKRSFSKIFSNYPFGLKDAKESEPFIEYLKYSPPKYRSTDWIYNLLLVESLSNNGKAIAIMTNGACLNGAADKDMKAFFVKNGFIDAIIAFPPKMFPEMNLTWT
jgi:predicted RNA methylase